MSAQFTDSFFSISRQYQQIATGDACSAVSVDDLIKAYSTGGYNRVPHWIRVRSLQGSQLEIDLFGKPRSTAPGAVIVARRRDSRATILSKADFNEEFVPMGRKQLLVDTDNEGEQQ